MHTSQRLWLLDRRQWTGCHRYDIIRVSPRYPGRAPCVTFSSCSYMWYMFTFLFNQFYFVQLFNIFRHCTIPQRPASFPRIDLRTGTAVCGPRRRLSKRHSDAVQRNHELRQLFWRGVRKLHGLRLQCKYVYLYSMLSILRWMCFYRLHSLWKRVGAMHQSCESMRRNSGLRQWMGRRGRAVHGCHGERQICRER